MTKDMAQNRNGWHMKTRAGPFLHIAENVRKQMSTDLASTLVACKLVYGNRLRTSRRNWKGLVRICLT